MLRDDVCEAAVRINIEASVTSLNSLGGAKGANLLVCCPRCNRHTVCVSGLEEVPEEVDSLKEDPISR